MKNFIISPSPHLLNNNTTKKIMWTVVICLAPATAWGIYKFGLPALIVVLCCIISSMIAEFIVNLINKDLTVFDGSAFLTGLLLGLNMPPEIPVFIPVCASFFAIIVVKHVFGGLGNNWANPAIAARVFAVFAWTKHMTTWTPPLSWAAAGETVSSASVNAVSSATPLGIIASNSDKFLEMGLETPLDAIQNWGLRLNYWQLFIGDLPGCIGEISKLLLLIGALYLIYKKIITLDIPVSYIGTVFLLSWIIGGLPFNGKFFTGDPVFYILTGGLFLGALYMATDMVTSPVTFKGRIIYGIGCGFFTVIIRLFGGFPEGVMLAILLMNVATPLIDSLIKRKPLGYPKNLSRN